MKIDRIRRVLSVLTMILLLFPSFAATMTLPTISQREETSILQNTTMGLPPGKNSMTFTSDVTMNLTTGITLSFTSGFKMNFTSQTTITFFEATLPKMGVIQPCFVGQMVQGGVPALCSWWEILDALGKPTGFEFHVDGLYPGPGQFHVDQVFPGPYNIPLGVINIQAVLKIYEIYACTYYVVRDPPGWTPPSCSWWEILYPPEWHGVEFHVDGSGGGEFHIDNVIGPMIPLPLPVYEVVAERKIGGIKPCDYFTTSPGQAPEPCSWWEILSPTEFKGYEFHVDQKYANGTFHVDQVNSSSIVFPTPTPEVIAEKKISAIQPCVYLKYASPSGYVPTPCDWWEIIYPDELKGCEFHIDGQTNGTHIHIDLVAPPVTGIGVYYVTVERKIDTIRACDLFKVVDPPGWHPDICSWWKIIAPPAWAGVLFHVDSFSGGPSVYKFHIDEVVGGLPPAPSPWPWNVTVEPTSPPMYWKKGFPDYAPSGMPDFDERQSGTYNWSIANTWSHCSPTAVANSLWWLDSEFEKGNIPPPTFSDTFSLITSYASMGPFWDDHDPRNVQPLIEHLAYLMDTDGLRTVPGSHFGTYVADMEAGLAQYLSWTGVNPIGDVNGDGVVNATDYNIVYAANNTVPGVPGWNMAADIYPVTTGGPTWNWQKADNVVNQSDINLVVAHMNQNGTFSERTVIAPDFDLIEKEVEKCEDVVLNIGFWVWTGAAWERENYTYPYPNTGINGHTITVAGVNSTTLRIAISDPAFDAFENGLITYGRTPVPHVHLGPEPPYTTHNNASLVSQDIYSVSWISPPFPPCPGGNWTIVGYGNIPGVYAVIESAVITSPIGVHDVAVTNVKPWKSVVFQSRPPNDIYKCPINVTVADEGNFPEVFNVTLYVNNTSTNITSVAFQTLTLTSGKSKTVTLNWTTTGFAKFNYTVKAAADIVDGETHVADNNLTDGGVFVSMIGDLTNYLLWPFVPDGKSDGSDLIVCSRCYGSNPTSPPPLKWDPNCDITNDNKIDGSDLIIVAHAYGSKDP